jgi:hypothetical protein
VVAVATAVGVAAAEVSVAAAVGVAAADVAVAASVGVITIDVSVAATVADALTEVTVAAVPGVPLTDVGEPLTGTAALGVSAALGTRARGSYVVLTGPPPTFTVETTLPFDVSTTVNVFWARSAMKARRPSELNVTAVAADPTGTVRTTFRVAVSTSATWLVG